MDQQQQQTAVPVTGSSSADSSSNDKAKASAPAGPKKASVEDESEASPSHAESHAALPDPSLPAPALAEEDVGFTAADLIARQARLEAQATEAIPFKFDTCTHSMGYIRQPIYACKTCGGGGVCAGCSVACHAEHDLVELFNKRNFRCDCGTPNLYRRRQPADDAGSSAQASQRNAVIIEAQLEYPPNAPPCSLRKPGFDPQNEANRYNHNFEGGFCYCVRGRTYDPEKEDETMFQCLVCEEWLHESCTSLRPHSKADQTTAPTEDDGEPPLIDHDLFDLMICDACVRKDGNQMLRRYAGSRGWMVLLPSSQCTGAASLDGIDSIRVPTDEAKARPTTNPAPDAGSVRDAEQAREKTNKVEDEPTWQLFGLPLHPTPAEAQTREGTVGVASVDAGASNTGDAKADEDHKAKDVSASGDAAVEAVRDPSIPLEKRKADDAQGSDDNGEGPAKKKAKAEDSTAEDRKADGSGGCRMPTMMDLLASVPTSVMDPYVPALSKESDADGAATRADPTANAAPAAPSRPQRYDIFLSEDFRSRICRCAACLERWSTLPFVLEAEETYSPPSDHEGSLRAGVDDDAASVTSSTYDLGMAALRTMPREKMLNSLQAYNNFRDALWEHLRPFAGTGKAVSEEDVRAFFRKRMGEEGGR